MSTATKEFYSVSEACEFLELSQTIIKRYIREERLPATKVGNQWIIRIKDLRKFKQQPRPRGNPDWIS